MAEQIFYDSNGVKITQARFIVNGQTFSLANITSVEAARKTVSLVGPIILTALGGLIFLGSLQNSEPNALAILILIVGLVWGWGRLQPEYHVSLRTSGGETKAYSSPNEEEIRNIVEALNDAIIARG